jgi:competence protein ComEC
MKEGQAQLEFLNSLLAAFCGGIVLAGIVPLSAYDWGILAAGLLVVCFYLFFRDSMVLKYMVVLLFLSLGALGFISAGMLPATDISHIYGQEVRLGGTLLEAPRVVEDDDGSVKLRYVIEAKQLWRVGEKLEKPVSGKVYVYARAQQGTRPPEARIGDFIQAAGTVKLLHGYQNPGRVDTVQAARTKGITAQISVGKRGIDVRQQDRMLFLRQMENVRAQYLASMQSMMPHADAAAIFAMLFGGYEGIRPELLEAFTTTGIVHILSVSGSHITLLAASIAWMGGWLRFPRWLTAFLVILAIVIYSVLSGCVPPVIRAGIMGVLTFLALVLERGRDARRILTLTGLFMLLVSPLLLFDISFQLSFLATAGLLYMGPVVHSRMHGWPEFVSGSMAITLSAQLFTLPLLAWYFHMVSLSSLLANLAVVPVVEFMIVIGLFAGLIGFFLPIFGKIVFFVDSLLLGAVYELTRMIARLPGSQIYVPVLGAGTSAVYYVLLGFWLQPQERRMRVYRWLIVHRQGIMGSGLCLGFFVAGYYFTRPPELAVHFIDVGQGDAALVVTPHGRAFMIDTGGTRDRNFDVGRRVDVPYLLHYGVRQLDGIFLTHAHEDHAAGVGGILKKLPVQQVFIGSEDRTVYAKSMGLSIAAPELRNFVPLHTGAHIELDGVSIEVLYAPQLAKSTTGSPAGNEISNVIRVRYGRASFLFTGDLVKEQEAVLLAEAIPLASTVLKTGHHGSKTSTSPEFLQAVAPRWAVISVGADNGFGHPHAEILARLVAGGVKTYRTDENGAVVFYTDGSRIRTETYRQ